jgi:lipoprotein-anchoring transpeptidase ErfK/SrfK
MLTRRHFAITTAAVFSTPIPGTALAAPTSDRSKWSAWDAQVTPVNYDPATSNPWGFHPRFLPQRVQANAELVPGDIHVDAVARYLYHIGDDGTARRFGVAIARGNLYEPGTYTIRRKVKWPTWTPTVAMIKRDPACIRSSPMAWMPGPPTRSVHALSTSLSETGILICAFTAHQVPVQSGAAQVRAV